MQKKYWRNKGEKIFSFPVADGTAKVSGKETTSTPTETNWKERRSQWRTSWRTGRASTDRINKWRWSPKRLLGRSKVTSSIVITMNLEFNSICRRKRHSQFHWNTLMLPGPLDSENHLTDWSFHLGQWSSIIRFQQEIKTECTNLGREFTCNISWICIDRGWNMERRYSDCWSGRIGENGRTRNLSPTSQCQRSTDLKERRRLGIAYSRWDNEIDRKIPQIPRNHSVAGTHRMEGRFQWRTSRRIGRASTDRTNRWRWSTEWLFCMQRDFIYRHHGDSSVQLYVPKEETFPIPLKVFDVKRYTHTNLDVMQEKRIDDYWNVNENRSLSDTWAGFHNIYSAEPPKKYLWSGCEEEGGLTDWQKFRRQQDQITRGQKCGQISAKQPKNEKNKKWRMRSRSSRTRAKWAEFILLIRKTKNMKRLSRMQEESWKCLWKRPYRARRKKSEPAAFRKL